MTIRVIALLGTAWLTACSAADDAIGIDGASLAFTVSPIATSQILFILPLGALEVPGHITPSDHIYLYFADPDHCPCDLATKRPVYAAARGRVKDILHGVDDKLTIQAADRIYYHYGNVRVRAGLGRGDWVQAGDQVGTTSGLAYGVDLGVINYDLQQHLLSPDRYADDTRYADQPLRFFAEPLRSQFTALVRRAGSDKNGRVSFDVAGTLAGAWFLEGLSAAATRTPEGWSKTLSFVYDQSLPNEVRVAIGGTIDSPGVYGLAATDPLPENITPASGPVTLHLVRPGTHPLPYGRLLVQLVDPARLRVEKFTIGTNAVAFTGNARTYVR
jgi:hypothetical protein